jgi:hypothetical protein
MHALTHCAMLSQSTGPKRNAKRECRVIDLFTFFLAGPFLCISEV